MQTRLAAVRTIDEEKRTVDLVWSTGATVRRFSFWSGERYDESLSLDPAHVDLTRLNNGAPLLNTHGTWDLSDVIGVVERAAVDGEEGTATVRFSERAEAEEIFRDVKGGIIRNVSVGYTVRKFEVTKEEGKIPLYRAVDWEPMELSLVPVGADAGAGTRSAQAANACEIVFNRAMPTSQEKPMDKEEVQPAGSDPAATRTAATDPAPNQQATSRLGPIGEYRKIAKALGMPEGIVLDAIERNISVDEFRAEAINKRAEEADKTPTRSQYEFRGDGTQGRREAVQNALLHRADPGHHALTADGRQYRGMSLLEIGRDLLHANGANTRGMSRAEVAGAALGLQARSGGMHTTSDFPTILGNVARASLVTAYEQAPRTFLPIARKTTLPDFKPVTRVQMGEAPRLLKVNEHGEYKYGTIGEGKEQYQLATYGRIFAITRQAIINDDMDAFTDWPGKFGRAAADMESDVVWGIVINNPAMGDGKTLFHADHGNLAGSGTALDEANLALAEQAMTEQKTADGETYINVRPAFLVVAPDRSLAARKLLNLTTKANGEENIYVNTLKLIVEPRLKASPSPWFTAADPRAFPTIEYAYLEGEEGVQIQERTAFEIDGVEIKAREDFAAKAVDWRGLTKNPGL